MIDDVAMNVLVPSSDDDPVNIVLTTANVPGGLERDTEYDITVVVVTEFSRTLSDPITVCELLRILASSLFLSPLRIQPFPKWQNNLVARLP